MDLTEEIKLYTDFFETGYSDKISQAVSSGAPGFVISFKDLAKFNLELAQHLLDSSDFKEILNIMGLGLAPLVENYKLVDSEPKVLEVYIDDLPTSQFIQIKDIRKEDLGKVFQVECIIKNVGEVKHRITKAIFECPSCGDSITVLQHNHRMLTEPKSCGCGRKGKFRLLRKDLVDHQWVEVQSPPERMKSGAAAVHKKVAYAEGGLVDKSLAGRFRPGARVIITCMPEEIPEFFKQGPDSVVVRSVLMLNHVRLIEQEFDDIVLTPKDKSDIECFAKEHDSELLDLFVGSLAPGIFGNDIIKLSIVLQLFGGVDKESSGGGKLRGNFHILLVGDPASGKSQILKQVQEVAPKARFTVGGATSNVGLSATVVRNELTGEFCLEAGVLVLADKGLVLYDEFDKSSDEDKYALHESLEQQTVTVSKASINVTLPANICLLAAANPKQGRFDVFESFYSQIDLPPPLVSRFDVIWVMRDEPNEAKDRSLSDFVLKRHKAPKKILPLVDSVFFRKYVAYAKQNCRPVLSDDAMCVLQEFYLSKRKQSPQEGAFKSVAITTRHLDALVRLSEACAKAHLRNDVLKSDACVAIDLIGKFLSTFSTDSQTGQGDVDALFTGVTFSTRAATSVVVGEIKKLSSMSSGGNVDLADLEKTLEGKVGSDKLGEVLERLKKMGEIIEPRNGFVRLV